MKRMFRVVVVIFGVALVAWASKRVLQDREQKQKQKQRGREQTKTQETSEFTRLDGVRLRAHRHNDGDSFHVIHEGREYEFRLYFVDAPESRYKTYRGGQNNGKRLDDQGRYFGGLSRDQAAAVGARASIVTAELLGHGPFTVFTRFEPVFDSDRFYAFVRPERQKQWLFQTLVDQGLARIYTKGAKTPDGVSWRDARSLLKKREEHAKYQKVGGWKMGE